AGRILAVLACAVLGMGLFSATALAGKKKKTSVIFFAGSPKVNKGGNVSAKGSLNTSSACRFGPGVRLQLTDARGTVISTLDGSTSDSNGNWSVGGKLPTLSNGNYGIRVKATKATAGKFVCQAGASAVIPFQVPIT